MAEQPEVHTETETRICRECQNPFEATLVLVGRIRTGPTVCEVCAAAEDEKRRQASAPVAGDPLARLAAIGVNVRKHGRLTLKKLGHSGATIAAKGFAGDVLAAGSWDFVRGLYLSGPTGVGKTQLAVSTVRAVIEAGYRGRIVFDRARALITTIQDRYGSGNVDEAIAARRTAGLWVLDDLGTEKPTADALRILEDILDSREGHPTILTSNMAPAELAERWAPADTLGRFRSRLGPQNYRAVELDGEDWRFNAA